MRQTRSRTKALNLPADVSELEKEIDLLAPEELRQLLSYRSSDKSSVSSLRARSYELLRLNYSTIKPKLKTIVSSRKSENSYSNYRREVNSTNHLSIDNIPHTIQTQPQRPVATRLIQPPIGSFLYQFQQFANVNHNNNNNTNNGISTNTSISDARIQETQTQRSLFNNGSIMYQSNIGMVSQTANNGVIPHGNGMVTNYSTPTPASMTQNLPIHPDVKLKKLAFFDILGVLLKPSTLMPSSSTQRMQETTYHFSLSPQQATDIAINRDIRNAAKAEYVVQVQLRFCVLETSTEQDDCFPPNVSVKVNNKACALPNPIPTNKPGVEPKRPPRPVNVTSNVKLSPTVMNSINVSWCTDFNRGFVVSAYLVKKLTSCELLQRMKKKGIKPIEFTRQLIKEKLSDDPECEIKTTELRVSLICPLGKMRMTTPCRASTCSHLQCFDASLYLQMNERKPTWNCPVCDKAAVYDTLVIDGYFQDVLSSSNLPSDINEIQLLKDGSWAVDDKEREGHVIDTPRKSGPKFEVISDDIEVIIDDDSPPKANNKSHHTNSNNQIKHNDVPSQAVLGDAVDLTLSDSDDEVVAHRKNTNNTVQSTKPRDGTPVITNDTSIISLDSPSPPSTPIADSGDASNASSTHVERTVSVHDEYKNWLISQMAIYNSSTNAGRHFPNQSNRFG